MIRDGKIGVFDSGYGGLTVLKSIKELLPDYHYLYLGDNARAPYGNRSFEIIYEYTLEAINFLFNQGCELIIIACNTASAKALRNIQQIDLPKIAPNKRVLGVIRPSTEIIGDLSQSKVIGVLGTEGTINSNSYVIELKKISPEITVVQHACPLWVPLVESNQHKTPAGKLIIEKDLDTLLNQNPKIDTIVLACTHYPILAETITTFLGPKIRVFSQGPIVAEKLQDYLKRHSEIETRLDRNANISFFTTENTNVFNKNASLFFNEKINAQHVHLNGYH